MNLYNPSDFVLMPLRELEGIEQTEKFQELVASMRARLDAGLTANAEPILFYTQDGRKVVESGHCRVLAARIIGCQVWAEEVAAPISETGRILEQLTINMLRQDMNAMDLALAFARLQNEGLSIADIAKPLGKSDAYVSMHLGLLNLAPALQDRVRHGELGYRAAYEMSVLPPKTQQQKMPQLQAVKTVKDVKAVKEQVQAEIAVAKAEAQLVLPTMEPPIIAPPTEEIPQDQAVMEQVAALIAMAIETIREARRVAEEHHVGIDMEIARIVDACQ